MDKFRIIAGPCSAESESQVMRTAEALKAAGVEWFRAGLWKPRTYPGCFEGVGEKGLPWMQKVQRELGMKVCTEVAGAEHVRMCADAGLNMFWIGARTTVNSFLVEEIADACGGLGIPVLIKNPAARDIGLWIGAVERFRRQGVTELGLVHRGFPSFGETEYRNSPEWQVAIEMHSKYPELPMLCDPSHIAGDADLVPEVAQTAMSMGFNGLMVEAHCCPDAALSDKRQQMEAGTFGAFLSSLQYRNCSTDNPEFNSRLEVLRSKIDECDSELIRTLARRMEISRQIGTVKKEENIAIMQISRWDRLLERILQEGAELGMDRDLLSDIFNLIHNASVKVQNEQ